MYYIFALFGSIDEGLLNRLLSVQSAAARLVIIIVIIQFTERHLLYTLQRLLRFRMS